jgi:hypothetical protein
MKMKIFKGGNVRILESKINKWLQSEGIGLFTILPTLMTAA